MEVKNDLENIYYIPALRGLERLQYELLEGPNEEFVHQDFSKQNNLLVSKLAYEQDNVEVASNALEQLLSRKIRTDLSPGQKIRVQFHNGKRWINALN